MAAERDPGRWADENEDQVELPAFLMDPKGVLERRWTWMLPVLLLGLLVSVVAVARMDPIYAATAKVLITKQPIPKEFVRPTVVDDPLANVNAMVGQALSKNSLAGVIEELDLYGGDDMLLADRVQVLRWNITVEPAKKQGGGESLVYDVTFRDGDPVLAAQVATKVSELLIDASIETRGAHARRTTAFLRKNLEQQEQELEQAARRVADFRREHRGTLPSELETSLRKLDMLAQRRESISSRIASSENMIATLAASGRGSESQTLLANLRQRLAAETAAHTDEHPNVIALREQVKRLEREVARTGGIVADPATQVQIQAERRTVAHLHEQLAATEAEIAELNGRIDRIPKVGEELAILEQKEQALRETHLQTLRKVSEAEVAENLETREQGARVSLLDAAPIPGAPERNRLKWLLAGIFVSFVSAIGLGVLLELLDPIVLDVRQLESALGGPALGALPRIGD